ncbi:hypothetical protein QL093DRAFT_2364497 [Fusarium oxysporum]|nr:hypothetical protein QL093DRAFT_2364497 [Fusarium oxysporum]
MQFSPLSFLAYTVSSRYCLCYLFPPLTTIPHSQDIGRLSKSSIRRTVSEVPFACHGYIDSQLLGSAIISACIDTQTRATERLSCDNPNR